MLQELAAIAFADRTEIAAIKSNGRIEFTPTEKLSANTKKSISQIKQGKFGKEVYSYDKVKALELIGKHLGIFEKKQTEEETIADDGFIDALNGTAAEDWVEDEES